MRRQFNVSWRTAKSQGSKTVEAKNSAAVFCEIQRFLSQNEGDGIHVVSARIIVKPV
jgi:ribulose bisphosphate carboxylase small subunit